MAEALVQQPQTADIGKVPDTHFVYWFHAPYNISNILPELENADVMLLESPVNWSKGDKTVNEAWINASLGAELTEGQQALSNVVPLRGLNLVPLYKAVSEHFAGSGKAVRLLDANAQDNPEFADRAALKFDIAHSFNERLGDDFSLTPDVAEIGRAQQDALAAQAVSASERDQIILRQIEAAREEFAGQQIAVVYGSGHTQLSHAALRDGYGRRTFVDGVGSGAGVDGTKVKYNLAIEIIRRLQFGLPVSEEKIIRSLLQSSLTSYLAQARGQDASLAEYDMEQWDYDTADLMPQTDKIARSASREDLDNYTYLIDHSYLITNGDIALHNFVGELSLRA
jgi:hypothetical protein